MHNLYKIEQSRRKQHDMTIKELRKRYGFTQAAFAEYFGFPLRTVASWESDSDSGRSCPTYLADLVAYKLAKEFPEK